jgi:tetraacyldisaccharide 4'-kinase
LREAVTRLAPGAPVVETTHRAVDLVNGDQATAELALLSGRPVAAFCGLGNPDAFRRSLEGLGARVAAFRTFPDHHPYTRADVEALHDWARQATEGIVLTTQKDMVKLRLARLGGRPLWALRIRLHVEAGEDALHRELQKVLSAAHGRAER